MNEIVRLAGIFCGLAIAILSVIGLYFIALNRVYFVDLVFVYSSLIVLLLLLVSGFYLVWYCYQNYLKSVK